MIKWEYKIMDFTQTEHLYTECLNKMGDEGWELAAMARGYFIFKRPKSSEVEVNEVRLDELARDLENEDL